MRCRSPRKDYSAASNHWPARSSRSLRGVSKRSWASTVSVPAYLRRGVQDDIQSSRHLCRRKPYHKPLIFRRHANRGCLRAGQILNDRCMYTSPLEPPLFICANIYVDEIIECIGEGTTATVLEAWDTKEQSRVVIKIQKASDRQYVMREIEILRTIGAKHADAAVIRLFDWFESPDNQNICMVFEKGVVSLWDYMMKHPRFCLRDIQMFGKQLLTAISGTSLYCPPQFLTYLQQPMIVE